MIRHRRGPLFPRHPAPTGRRARAHQTCAQPERTLHVEKAAGDGGGGGWCLLVIRREVDQHRDTRNGRFGTIRGAVDMFRIPRVENVDLVAVGLYTRSVNASGKSLNGAPHRYLRTIYISGRRRCGDWVLNERRFQTSWTLSTDPKT